VGITEIATKLGITKGAASKLASRGMPTHSVDAANAWRSVNAPPRNREKSALYREPSAPKLEVKVKEPAPIAQEAPLNAPEDPAPVITPKDEPKQTTGSEPEDDDNTPRQSLRRARLAEKVGYNELVVCKKNGGSVEDIRKANSIYIAARNNRFKAEKDFREWQRMEAVTLFLDEAKEIYGRPHQAERQILETMPKTLAPRMVNQPQKAIEATLTEWVDRLIEVRRRAL
jgi:hypothetical protein